MPRHDLAVVGAGLVGAAFTLALQGSGLRVVLLDRGERAAPVPSDAWDRRVFAISPGSADFLHALGVWARLPADRLQPVERMSIWNEPGARALQFDAYELARRALAWIVEQRCLQEVLRERLAEAAGTGAWLELRDQVVLEGFTADDREVRLNLAGGQELRARLVVGADGLDSCVRAGSGIVGEPEPYGHSAVVANFSCARPHRGGALQWFLPDGSILALLPLPGECVSMVWSAPDAHAARLAGLAGAELAEEVQRASCGLLGPLQVLTSPARYPLRFLRLARPIAPRFALIGDAAHGVHPLAGQGVNLGFGDAAALARVLETRAALADAGDYNLLARYARARLEPVASMQVFTHSLWQLLQGAGALHSGLRRAAFAAAGGMPLLRRLLAQPALR